MLRLEWGRRQVLGAWSPTTSIVTSVSARPQDAPLSPRASKEGWKQPPDGEEGDNTASRATSSADDWNHEAELGSPEAPWPRKQMEDEVSLGQSDGNESRHSFTQPSRDHPEHQGRWVENAESECRHTYIHMCVPCCPWHVWLQRTGQVRHRRSSN